MTFSSPDGLLRIAQDIAGMAESEPILVASAESCTGGLIARTLTSVAGASSWFHTGVIAYTYDSKHRILGIPSCVLDCGLVNMATAEAMAKRVAELSGADYTISTTGVSGPGSSEGHAPCYAWIGLRTPKGLFSQLVEGADHGRAKNTQWIAMQALTMLADAIRDERSIR